MRWSEGVLVSPVWGERGREVDCWLGCLDCMRLGDIFLREQFHKRCPAGRLIVDLVPWDCCWWRCKKQQWPLTYVVVGLRSVFVTLLNYYVMLCFKYDFTHKIPIPRPPVWCERGREVDCWLGCLDCMRLGDIFLRYQFDKRCPAWLTWFWLTCTAAAAEPDASSSCWHWATMRVCHCHCSSLGRSLGSLG